jgi:hypothetical protein
MSQYLWPQKGRFIKKLASTSTIVVGLGALFTVGCSNSKDTRTEGEFIDAHRSCVEMSERLSKYPSSFHEDWFSLDSDTYFKTGRIQVRFSVKNAFGMKIAGIANCKTINGAITLTDVQMEDGTQIVTNSDPDEIVKHNSAIGMTNSLSPETRRTTRLITAFQMMKMDELGAAFFDQDAHWTTGESGFLQGPTGHGGHRDVVLDMQDLKSGKHYSWILDLEDGFSRPENGNASQLDSGKLRGSSDSNLFSRRSNNDSPEMRFALVTQMRKEAPIYAVSEIGPSIWMESDMSAPSTSRLEDDQVCAGLYCTVSKSLLYSYGFNYAVVGDGSRLAKCRVDTGR